MRNDPLPPKLVRKRIPLKVKLASALIALGLDPKRVDFHHDPPLEMRLRRGKNETIPPQLDPRFITPMDRAAHKLRTHGTHIPLSGDLAQIRKMKRIEAKRLGLAPKRRGRAFPKRKKGGKK